ncbi:hypothetical protein [Marinactinospora rubrisoli]|uniref:Helix-turn-helix domain-containing protein n=1 Tax=Marinactinospora rubrisoli TaxID=2715399 RepID=A0ABW2KQS8_9ACTN
MTPRAGTRHRYGIQFSPYMWVRDVPLATPVLHVVAEAIATAVDPDGCYCWQRYETIAANARDVSKSAIVKAIDTLAAGGVLRNIKGDERFRILDEGGVSYSRDKPPAVLELLIPLSAYSAEDLERVQRMRSDKGRPPLTAESRPDITEMVGERKKRSDKGKSAPQRRRKDVRQSDAEWAEQQPSLHAAQDAAAAGDPGLSDTGPDVSETPPSDGADTTSKSPVFLKHHARCFSNTTPGVSETPNPPLSDPRRVDPDLRPSVGAQPQEESPHVDETDGTDEWDSTSAVNPPATAPGGADAPPVPPQTPSSVAEMIVDGLLADTAHAAPLADPQGDRGRLVALAQSALDRGITPQRLREITSRGLHNVRKQWALATRLADPEGFAQVAQPEFGGRLLPVPAARPPLCETHPECDRTRSGRCAECVVEERLRWIEDGTLVEWAYDAESDTWTDTDGQEVRGDQLTPEEQAAIEEEAAAFAAAKAAAAGGGGESPNRADVLALVRQSLEDARLRSRRERGLPTAPDASN